MRHEHEGRKKINRMQEHFIIRAEEEHCCLQENVPELYSTVPEVYSTVPEVHSTVPELYSTVPELCSTVPELYSAVPELYSTCLVIRNRDTGAC